jgi:DNA-binding PadR family transcriptional regulator
LSAHSVSEKVEVSVLENGVMVEMRERVVRAFLDFIVLMKLSEGCEALSGYDFVKLVGEEFDVVLSAGSVYAVLYSMERDGLIQGATKRRKRVYTLTDKGEAKVKAVSEEKTKILYLFGCLFV